MIAIRGQPELPTGTVTFLFTDVEGSMRLLHEHVDAYADLLAEHRRVLRAEEIRAEGRALDFDEAVELALG